MSLDRRKEFEMLMDVFGKEGGDSEAIKENLGASMVLNKDEVIHVNSTKGVIITSEKIEDGIKAQIRVVDNHKEEKPVHLCFGMLPKEGRQVIESVLHIGKNAKVKIMSHCIFPNAVNIEHIMDGKLIIEEGGELIYEEEHFHSDTGKIKVIPKFEAIVEKNAKFFNNFYLKKGKVGELYIDYHVKLKESAVTELITKIYGKEDDIIETKEKISLEGENARGLILGRIVLKDKAQSKFIGITEGLAPNTRAHVDCTEIIMDQAKASAIPEIISHHPSSKLTHEAAIGQIDQKQLQTLMAKGLTEDQAIEIIVNGILS